MLTNPHTRYWNQYVDADGAWKRDPRTALEQRPPGEDLATLRSGLGQPAGSVLAMWRFYTCVVDEKAARRDEVSEEQAAEHAALALFGLHQQSQQEPMHHPTVGVGQALRALRHSDRFSEDAVDARVEAAATATSVTAVLYRLRGLVTQLRTIRQPLDYDLLMKNINDWHYVESRQRVRRAWGLGYYVWGQEASVGSKDKDTTSPSS
ncbi:type I-E CRISPR-associated protein Cse2/CasB [Frankia sp. Cr2]|uniref:type I-E CRISPR-associated protein Cse2/CasB n=1 Tax=Frankia sp. Cr2 TaxID=3073932 RepID=UPI002AD4E9C3|nr:type I-E CRISPR-associated protein Cse2/CasB [Frankia sp. Cr2]